MKYFELIATISRETGIVDIAIDTDFGGIIIRAKSLFPARLPS